MARDLKLIQRGVNVQANDLAVPPGTPVRAQNIDFQRDGVAARRAGFASFYTGLPSAPFDYLRPVSSFSSGATILDLETEKIPRVQGIDELFSRDRSFLYYGGFPFVYDDLTDAWAAVPISMPHRFTFFGSMNEHAANSGVDLGTDQASCGIGRAVYVSDVFRNYESGEPGWSPFSLQLSLRGNLYGDIGNRANQAAESTGTLRFRFGQIADSIAPEGLLPAVSSDSSANVIWRTTGGVFAGSLTASGATDGLGTAATFTGPSWMAFSSTKIFVADNTNMIRQVAYTGSVTVLAGSITAGDSDGYFAPAAAQWSNVNASSDAAWGSITFSSSLGSGSGRLCAIETSVATTKAMTSDDGGATWTARTLPSSRTWRSVVWAAGLSLFVAVASDGTVAGRCATSPDGITWTARTMPDGEWASVAWSSTLSRLVAVGLSGGPNYACTSTNGTSWTTSGVTQIGGYWVSVVSAGALGFVALGQFDTGNGQIMVASTGLNWSVSGVSVPEANQWKNLTWSGSLLVAVSIDGTNRVMTSANGTTWTAVAAAAANQWYAVTWSDSFDVFIAVSVDGTNRIMYSATGTGGWTSVAAPDTKQWAAIVDVVSSGYNGVVSTALADLDSVMRATVVGATATGALFRTISGLTYADGYLYVSESSGNRIRKVDVTSGAVSLLAGSSTAVAGLVNGTGSAARFSVPNGLELIGGDLYVGDSGNNVIRKITLDGVVTTYTTLGATLASPVLRGRWQPRNEAYDQDSAQFLVIENSPASGTLDVYLAEVTDQTSYAHHVVRCPSGYPDGATGPNKLDTFGPNLFSLANASGSDCADGAVFATSQRPHTIDEWSRIVTTDAMPSMRAMGIMAPEAPVTSSISGTTFSAGTAVAYRVVVGMNLPNGRIAIGPPSERIILIGSATAAWSGSITAYPSPGLPYDDVTPFFQVYRTRSASSITDPGDQMFLCYESAISYGSGLQFTDQCIDDLLGAELYTNTTQDGIAATALAPPTFANDVAAFGNSVVLADALEPVSITLKVLGTSTLVAGASYFTLTPTPLFPIGAQSYGGAVRFTAISGTTSPSTNEFQIASGGTSAQNAVQTARNIVSCINRSPDAMAYTARYDESEPGTVIVTSLWPGTSKSNVAVYYDGVNWISSTTQAAITFSASSASVLTSISVTQQASSKRKRNEIRYSEPAAYDSFPAINAANIGNTSDGIVRLLPLSDVLIAVKEDSVWSMDQGFEPRIYDTALSCVLPQSFARVNNQWIGCFTRGFVSLGASQGVAIGRPIDRDVSAQYGAFLDGFSYDIASAAAIDLSGNYLCTFNSRAYVYNVVAQAWSEWSVDLVAGNVSGGFEPTTVGAYQDSFIVAQEGARSVLRQRRYQRDGGSFYQDFADPTYSFGTATIASDLLTISVAAYDAETNPAELPPRVVDPPAGSVSGDGIDAAAYWWAFSITQGAVTVSVPGTIAVASPSSATSAITITLAQAVSGITAGSVTVSGYSPIICRVQYAPFAAPGSNASFGDALAVIERCQPGYMIARFFGRQDFGDATDQPVGWYGDAYGVSRARLMASITADDYGLGSLITYEEVVRFPTPRERAVNQSLGLELVEGVAWQPLAIKSASLDKGDKDNSKVNK